MKNEFQNVDYLNKEISTGNFSVTSENSSPSKDRKLDNKTSKENKPIETMGNDNFKNLLMKFQKKPNNVKNDQLNVSKLDPSKYKNFERSENDSGRIKGNYNKHLYNKDEKDEVKKDKIQHFSKNHNENCNSLSSSKQTSKNDSLSIHYESSLNSISNFLESKSELKKKYFNETNKIESFHINIVGKGIEFIIIKNEDFQAQATNKNKFQICFESKEEDFQISDSFTIKISQNCFELLTKTDLDLKSVASSQENYYLLSHPSNFEKENINHSKNKNSQLDFSIKKLLIEYNHSNNELVSQCEFTILNSTSKNRAEENKKSNLAEEEINYDDLDEVDEFTNKDKLVSKRSHILDNKNVEVNLENNSEIKSKQNEDFDDIEEIGVGERIHRIDTACEKIITSGNKVSLIKK